MTINTKYNIGDKITVNGRISRILSVHLYESDNKHTERYYLGDGHWITVVKKNKCDKGGDADETVSTSD